MKKHPLLPRKHLPHQHSKSRLTPKRRLALTVLTASALTLIASGIAGALQVPTGLNIAAAMIITIGLLVEAPLTAMAVAKHKHH